MFSGDAFKTWGMVAAGAALFAMLFAFAVMMLESVLGAETLITRSVVLMGLAAFAGYFAVAWLVRRRDRPTNT